MDSLVFSIVELIRDIMSIGLAYENHDDCNFEFKLVVPIYRSFSDLIPSTTKYFRNLFIKENTMYFWG